MTGRPDFCLSPVAEHEPEAGRINQENRGVTRADGPEPGWDATATPSGLRADPGGSWSGPGPCREPRELPTEHCESPHLRDRDLSAAPRGPRSAAAVRAHETTRTGGGAMTFDVSRHEPAVRLGVDRCPGVDERGHGLTMSIIHDNSCCAEWESGQASTPARAKEFREAAARWGAMWPEPEPEAGS